MIRAAVGGTTACQVNGWPAASSVAARYTRGPVACVPPDAR